MNHFSPDKNQGHEKERKEKKKPTDSFCLREQSSTV
jgi:hypothetical protein